MVIQTIKTRDIKGMIKGVPIAGPFLTQLRAQFRQKTFRGSSEYWDRRYRDGGNSGAGSYNRLAEFKADFLNRFVVEHQIATVIEFGSGDGSQLKLAHYANYIGVDVSAKAVEIARSLFAGDTSKRFMRPDELEAGTSADLSLSLDVVYHLVEDSVFDGYMRQLFKCARRYVIVYSSNTNQDWPFKHVRHRHFTQWVEQNEPGWCQQSIVKNAYPYDPADPANTSFADFHVFALGAAFVAGEIYAANP